MAQTRLQSRLFGALAVALPLTMAAAGVLAWYGGGDGGGDAARLSQSIPLAAMRAISGSAGGFTALEEGLGELSRQDDLPQPQAQWARFREDANTVLEARPAIETLAAAAGRLRQGLPPILGEADSMIAAGTAVAALQQFQSAGLGLSRSVELLSSPAADASAVAGQAEASRRLMQEILDGLAGRPSSLDIAELGGPARERLDALRLRFDEMTAALDPALAGGDTVQEARAASRRLAETASTLGAAAGDRSASSWQRNLLLALLAVGFLLTMALLFSYVRASRLARSALLQADQNERNQQAILRLLDELGSLADGDLTVEATVTEDITGAIADSINYAIEALRDLVTTINETAIMVDSAAKQTENTAVHMSRAAQKQSQEIAAASESIAAMAATIEEVSGNAERSADVARHSVDVAHKGGEAVRRTIDGMNTIRETIQETSKRIKRLGESSQEIGNIVELINDIAEQTNILALNASIQASMAGEAGRGFAVVADEVQRLAERSTNATKQIEVLVRTIQTDTNEAVVSMERSTTDVVGGALLAENAGAALDEIEQVSNQIASLVQNISGSAREQATAASDITRRTKVLRDISAQTGRATSATTSSIAKLSELASQLRQTVAGFRLPEPERDGPASPPVNEHPSGEYSEIAEERAAGQL